MRNKQKQGKHPPTLQFAEAIEAQGCQHTYGSSYHLGSSSFSSHLIGSRIAMQEADGASHPNSAFQLGFNTTFDRIFNGFQINFWHDL